jgi:hypothetical protein
MNSKINMDKSASIKCFMQIAFILASVLTFQESAYSIPTKWDDARMSMSDLLSTGWQLTAHGSNRVAANSNSGNSFDAETFSFVLAKGDKYIICFVENPSPPIARASSCRRLN